MILPSMPPICSAIFFKSEPPTSPTVAFALTFFNIKSSISLEILCLKEVSGFNIYIYYKKCTWRGAVNVPSTSNKQIISSRFKELIFRLLNVNKRKLMQLHCQTATVEMCTRQQNTTI